MFSSKFQHFKKAQQTHVLIEIFVFCETKKGSAKGMFCGKVKTVKLFRIVAKPTTIEANLATVVSTHYHSRYSYLLILNCRLEQDRIVLIPTPAKPPDYLKSRTRAHITHFPSFKHYKFVIILFLQSSFFVGKLQSWLVD